MGTNYPKLPKLPETSRNYPKLPELSETTRNYPKLPETTRNYLKLPQTTQKYPKLPKTNPFFSLSIAEVNVAAAAPFKGAHCSKISNSFEKIFSNTASNNF